MSLDLIKIGIRQNLLYPFLFMLGINCLRIIRIIIQEMTKNEKINPFFSLLTFLSNIVISAIFIYLENKANQSNKNRKIIGINLIQDEKDEEIIRVDSDQKILFLIFLDGFFEFISTIRKEYLLPMKPSQTNLVTLDIRIRSREILLAVLICYFTIGAQLNQHHIMSLVIILFCVITLYIYEVIHQFKNDYYDNILSFFELQGLKVVINIVRVFSDVIEKYLFDYDTISAFKILFLKGIVEMILMIIFFLFNSPDKEINSIFNNNNENKKISIAVGLFLSILYFIISGFTSIYKMYTVKTYTPMTRTLSDILFDFGYYIYYTKYEEDGNKGFFSMYFWANIIGQIISVFFNFVYNEFIVLNFCGFGLNTHYEISKRASNVELYIEDEGNNGNHNDNDNESENTENSFVEDINATTE